MTAADVPVLPLLAKRPENRDARWTETLTAAFDGAAIVRAFEDLSEAERQAADIAIVANPDPAQLQELPNVKWLQSLWAGVEGLIQDLNTPGLEIVRMSDPDMADVMAEAALAWSLYLHRDMPLYQRQQTQKIWQEQDYILPEDRRITVLGLGFLGTAAAYKLVAHGFDVHGWSRTPKTLAGIKAHCGEAGLHAALSQTDILVLLMPLTPQTKGLLNEETLSLLPRGARIINFARGPLIDDDALLRALDTGHIAHAVLDVFSKEPLPQDDPYWSHPNVTVLPHISAPTARKSSARVVAQNVKTWWETGALPGQTVDRQRGY